MGDGRNWEDPAETARWEADKGHHAEVPFLGPRPLPDPRPGAPRWFGRLVIAGAVLAFGAAVLVARAEGAERDARVSDLATEACTP